MEVFSSHLQKLPFHPLFIAGILLILTAIYTKANGYKKNVTKRPPEPLGSWPIIGHLRLIAGADRPMHRILGDMADKLGPVFSIRLGMHRALVVSDKSTARECFTANDRVFASRPQSIAVKIMGYDNKMFGLAPYGQYWRDMRKLATVELLSNHGLELMKHARVMEVNQLISELHRRARKNGGQVEVDMKQRFGDLMTNIMVRVIAGKRFLDAGTNGEEEEDEKRQWQKALGNLLCLMGLFMVSDTVPFLGWLDWMRGYVSEMKKTARELDGIFRTWVNEHREERSRGKAKDKDFIHVLLSALDDGNGGGHGNESTDAIVKATSLNLILGGSGPSAVTITWALSLLLNSRASLRKAQDELDLQVGRDRLVQESDIQNLVYLQAIVKESLRLYPATPLPARIALEDCSVAGFHVPAGTRLFVNLWKLHRDSMLWSEPLAFRPERFLEEHAKLDGRGLDFEYMPFGSGRRMCPGISFGLQVVLLALAQLLHGFEIRTGSDWQVDMIEGPGLTMPRARPLEVVLKPRLPAALYEYQVVGKKK